MALWTSDSKRLLISRTSLLKIDEYSNIITYNAILFIILWLCLQLAISINFLRLNYFYLDLYYYRELDALLYK